MSDRLYLSVEQTMRGERSLIVQTMNELAGALQSEVNKRSDSPKESKTPTDASTFLTTCSAQLQKLAVMFGESEAEFQHAVAPDGSPKMYVEAYAAMLDRIATAIRIVGSLEAPPSLQRTQQAFLGLAQSMYDQIAGWPRKIREGAQNVKGDEYRLQLEIDTKATPFQRALAADTKAMGL
jgi:hypothetical protein